LNERKEGRKEPNRIARVLFTSPVTATHKLKVLFSFSKEKKEPFSPFTFYQDLAILHQDFQELRRKTYTTPQMLYAFGNKCLQKDFFGNGVVV